MSILSLTIAVGCSGRDILPLDSVSGRCEASVVQTPEEAGWTGLTEDEVMARVEAFEPRSVSWDRMSPSESQSSIRVTWARTEAPAQVVERDEAEAEAIECRPGPELVLGMTFEVQINGGEVSSSFEGSISADPAGNILVDGLGDAALNETWDQVGQETAADDIPPEDGEARWRLGLGERWEAAEVGITGTSESWSKFVWAGCWSGEAL
ncbi:MAG: hypothetical protein ABMB14_23335 [Myxococcota bacterium]